MATAMTIEELVVAANKDEPTKRWSVVVESKFTYSTDSTTRETKVSEWKTAALVFHGRGEAVTVGRLSGLQGDTYSALFVNEDVKFDAIPKGLIKAGFLA